MANDTDRKGEDGEAKEQPSPKNPKATTTGPADQTPGHAGQEPPETPAPDTSGQDTSPDDADDRSNREKAVAERQAARKAARLEERRKAAEEAKQARLAEQEQARQEAEEARKAEQKQAGNQAGVRAEDFEDDIFDEEDFIPSSTAAQGRGPGGKGPGKGGKGGKGPGGKGPGGKGGPPARKTGTDLTVVKKNEVGQARASGVGPATPPTPPQRTLNVKRPRRYNRWLVALTFVLMVLLPAAVIISYLYEKAADEYHSITAFSVRSDSALASQAATMASSMEAVTGAADSTILYEFIQSQQMVENLQKDLDLKAMYNRAPNDVIFSLGDNASIEQLTDYWNWFTTVDYDQMTGLISITALAFTPEDAQAIARGVLDESTQLINSLSEQAREDAIRYAQQDLDEAQERLRSIRAELREFRDTQQTADPAQDVQVQFSLLTALQQSLADALIERAELTEVTRQNDPRIAQADRRIRAIRDQIAAERAKIGQTGESAGDVPLASTIGRFEELRTDLGFAESAYVAAQEAYDLARIEARRQSRYIAAHVQPTFSQDPQYPQRGLISAVSLLVLLVIWGVTMILVVNIWDRR